MLFRSRPQPRPLGGLEGRVPALPQDAGKVSRGRCLTFSKGQYLYILMGLVQMKTSVLGREQAGEAVCPQPPSLGPHLPQPPATAPATMWDTSPGPANHMAAPMQPATQG